MRFTLLCFTLLFVLGGSAQQDSTAWKTVLPNIVSTHPLGIFVARSFTNHGGKMNASSFGLETAMGNVWLPKVTAYFPTNPGDRDELAQYPWHFRGHQNLSNPDSISLAADGVLRTYRFSYNQPIADNQFIKVTAKFYSLDGGKRPYALMTSDRFIEWFHSNIAGGEDPFARKLYPFDQAGITYQDEAGNKVEIANGDLGMSGIELNYNYRLLRPWMKKYKLNLEGNILLGINSRRFNRSLDLGVGMVGSKDFSLSSKQLLRIGAGLEYLRMNALNSRTAVSLFDVAALTQSSFFIGWEKQLKDGNSFSISHLYRIQSSYRDSDQRQYYALEGGRDVSHWYYAISHLYETTFGNSLIIAYQRKLMNYGVYMRQDLRQVDNAPDIQTGVQLVYRL